MTSPLIHRHATGPAGALVNAYLVETAEGVVAVDATLTVSDARALRSRLDALGKPLAAVLVTHAHPDHYGGLRQLVDGLDVPILATAGVDTVIRRDDTLKEQILRPMFGDEWDRERAFPTRTVADGTEVELAGARFSVHDLGPSESPHDSIWLLGDGRDVFLGDQIYDRVHAYLADGFHAEWLVNIRRLRAELPDGATLHVGHGGPVTPAMFDWQEGYIETFLEAVRSARWSDPEQASRTVIGHMTAYLPSDANRFLMELSIEPVAAGLGLR